MWFLANAGAGDPRSQAILLLLSSPFVIWGIAVFFFAFIPAMIAEKKGRNFYKWHVYGFWLWAVALVHSLLMSEVQVGKTHGMCPFCKEPVRYGAVKCPHCREDLNGETEAV